jgi:hypothetical protein
VPPLMKTLGLRDPLTGETSSARLVGVLFALASVFFAFVHPENHVTLMELLGAATLALGLRTRAVPGASE